MKTRVLFVDDETNVLSGLRRMLRGFRDEWDMHFVSNAAAAFEAMAESPFDVIVSDMRMPDMDGPELLNKVQKLYPQTVRIVLSGQSDQESIQRTLTRTHQYLSKPCDPQLLKTTVSRACALRDKLANEGLKQLVSQVTSLPSLPDVYRDVLAELQSPDASIKRVAELISRDVAMTTKLLQLLNSSFFGLPRRIENPAHAAALLGLRILKPVVLSAGIFSQFIGTLHGYSIESFSNHSIAVGRYAERIAESEGTEKAVTDECHLAGLVHDVGQLVLAANLADTYAGVMEVNRQHSVPLSEAERHYLGADHADVGAYLLGLWGLPETIVEAVAFHHDPGSVPAGGFGPLTAVHVANVLVNETELRGADPCPQELAMTWLDRLGLAGRVAAWREITLEMLTEKAEA